MKVSYINIKDSLKQEPSSRLLFDSRIFFSYFFSCGCALVPTDSPKKYLLSVGLVFWHDLFKLMLIRSSFDTVVPHSSTDKRWSWVLNKLQHDQRSLSQVSDML